MEMEAFQEAAWSNNTLVMMIGIAVVCTLVLEILFPRSSTSNNNSNKSVREFQGPYLTYSTYTPPATFWTDMQVLRAMWFATITGDDLQERLDSFYETQSDLYDSYRIRMLHGRPLMLQQVARHIQPKTAQQQKKKGRLVWVDLACGTGYNVESFRTCLDECFFKIYLLDLCVPLCAVAKRDRADKYNHSGKKDPKITVVHGDATDFDCEGLPEAGTVDLVTISYSLVMIPDWRKAISNAQRLLRAGGLVAICDFTVAPDQSNWIKTFWKRMFASDHVFLDEQHLTTLHQEFDVVDTALGYGTLPYTPFFLQPAYYYFLGQKRGN